MAVKIFFCYAHEDELLLKKLKSHLRPLQRQDLIDVWYDRDISAGSDWEREISHHLNTAQVILLLISPDFMDSDYCYGIEMKRAIERHACGEALVIPIMLRYVYWQGEPLGKLQALPTDAKPVTSSNWHDLDEAFFNVVEGIRIVIERLLVQKTPTGCASRLLLALHGSSTTVVHPTQKKRWQIMWQHAPVDCGLHERAQPALRPRADHACAGSPLRATTRERA